MIIERVSPLTGNINRKDIPVTPEQMAEWESPGRRRMVQEIFHNLSDSDREFIMTGYTDEDWSAIFPPEEYDEAFPPDEDCREC